MYRVLVGKTWWQNTTLKTYAQQEVFEINVKTGSAGAN